MSELTREDLARVIWDTSRRDEGTISATGANIVADALLPLLRQKLAEAWDKGHRTFKRYGPDDCRCAAYSESECGCGKWGTNVITPNPYR